MTFDKPVVAIKRDANACFVVKDKSFMMIPKAELSSFHNIFSSLEELQIIHYRPDKAFLDLLDHGEQP